MEPLRNDAGEEESPSESRAELLGLSFDAVTMRAAVHRCLEWCERPRASHTVVAANPALLCRMRRDPELREACRAADLVLPDGISIVWASRLSNAPLPERVTGIDLMAHLLAAASEHGLGVYFLGGKPAVVEHLAGICAHRYPGLHVAGYRDGYFDPNDHAAIAADIHRREPHFLFLSLPSSSQEIFCARYRDRLKVPVILGARDSFDVLAGHLRRAPLWVQVLGLEWTWQLVTEPRRTWRRQLATNGEFLLLAGREILARRMAAQRAGSSLSG